MTRPPNVSVFCEFKLVDAEWRIYASVKKNTTGSDNGLRLFSGHQAIVWDNAGLLLIGPLWLINGNYYIFNQENAFENIIYRKNGGNFISVCLKYLLLSLASETCLVVL